MSPSTKWKNLSKEAMCRAVRVVRSGDTGYLRASRYFSVPRANFGEAREGYSPFLFLIYIYCSVHPNILWNNQQTR